MRLLGADLCATLATALRDPAAVARHVLPVFRAAAADPAFRVRYMVAAHFPDFQVTCLLGCVFFLPTFLLFITP